MGKRANQMAVRASLTYDIGEAARALDVTPATIRNWINDGLHVMSSRKPYLLLGAAIREYLREKYAKAKRPLGEDKLFCVSCKDGRNPKDMAVSLTKSGPKTSMLKGVCGQCEGISTRIISDRDVGAFGQTFRITKRPPSEP